LGGIDGNSAEPHAVLSLQKSSLEKQVLNPMAEVLVLHEQLDCDHRNQPLVDLLL
jgi:hypothetical protein